jgi:hypothetical protein
MKRQPVSALFVMPLSLHRRHEAVPTDTHAGCHQRAIGSFFAAKM